MTDETEQLKKRLLELADKAYQRGVYTHTGFLALNELAVTAQLAKALSHVPYVISGGAEQCERKLVQFGSEELCGYDQPLPIVCIAVRPANERFADELTHRDFLGALMHLGVERSTLGDIVVQGHTGYVFCMDSIAPFIAENLTQVRHTTVCCTVTDGLPASAEVKLTPETVQVSGERLDSIVARAYHLSREDSTELFRQKRVMVNSALCENNSAAPRADDIISVRGYGRFVYRGAVGQSKKGKWNLLIEKYEG